MTRDFTSHSADETVELGRQLAPLLKAAHLVLLRGDLGAGKTTLVKGIAEGFGAADADDVNQSNLHSHHEYHGPHKDVFHIDLTVSTSPVNSTLSVSKTSCRRSATSPHRVG